MCLVPRQLSAWDAKGAGCNDAGAPKRGAPSRWQPQGGGPVQQQPAAKRMPQTGGQGQQMAQGDLRHKLDENGVDGGGIEQSEGGEVKPRFPGDRVPMYTKKVHHRAAVALVAFASATALAMVLGKAIFSKSSIFVALVFATGCFFSCYTVGDFSQFSNALGVGTILFLRKLRPRQFFHGDKVATFLNHASSKKTISAVENPWTCRMSWMRLRYRSP